VIVVDASAAMSALLNDGPARAQLSTQMLCAPHLIDTELVSALRRLVRSGELAPDQGWAAIDTWRQLTLSRHPSAGLLARVWELRDNLSPYDATYVALAELLDVTLLTADARLASAPGVRCAITLIRR
jgi:predicted nucleic acid-binding protein